MRSLADSGVQVVLVGSSRHVPGSKLLDVPSVAGTVQDLATAFVERCQLDRSSLHPILDPDSPQRIENTLLDAVEKARSVVIFYYIGHGVPSFRGELHLATRATVDLSRGTPAFQALPFTSVLDVMNQPHVATRVVILDCCYSGRAPLLADTTGGGAGHGTYLLTAAAWDEVALAPPGAPHTTFSGHLLTLLHEGDPSGPRRLTVDAVYHYLDRVLADGGGPRPRRQVGGNAGDLVLADNPAWAAPVLRQRPPPVGWSEAESARRLCPYPGLRSFTSADADHFHGRGRLIDHILDRLVDRVRNPEIGMLAVVGASGSGKSSVLRAGLQPAVAAGRIPLPGRGSAQTIVFTPGDRPLEALVDRLAKVWSAEPASVRAGLEAGEFPAGAATGGIPDSPGDPIVLIVDQFEEALSPRVGEEQRQVFVDALAALAGARRHGGTPAALVVVAIGASFHGPCLEYHSLASALSVERVVSVGPMTVEELTEAIERPADAAGLMLEPGLVGRLLQDLGARTAAGYPAARLPLLSHALWSTWRRREAGDLLSLAAYEETGGINDAVARTAEAVYGDLDDAGKAMACRLLLRMVDVRPGADPSRRRPTLDELRDWPAGDGEVADRVLRVLSDARLVSLGTTTAELTHEALLAHWPALRGWVDSDPAGHAARQQITDAAARWELAERDSQQLLRGAPLAAAEEWRGHPGGSGGPGAELTGREREFLDTSSRHRRRVSRLWRALAATVVLLVVLVAVATVVASRQTAKNAVERTETNRQRAVASSRSTANEANQLRASAPVTAGQLGAAALRLSSTAEARASLLTTLTQTHVTDFLGGYTAPPTGLEYSADGTRLATVGGTGIVVWQVGPGRSRRLATLPGDADAATFSPSGRMLAVNRYGTMTLWDLVDPAHPRRLAHQDGMDIPFLQTSQPAAFSPDGKLLATLASAGSGTDLQVVLWDLTDPAHPARLPALPAAGGPLRFGAVGRLLVTGPDRDTSDDLLWNLADPRHPSRLSTLPEADGGLAVPSWDGRVLVTGGGKTTTLWDVSFPARPARLAVLPVEATAVAFPAGGDRNRLLVTSGTGGTVLWGLLDGGRWVERLTLLDRADAAAISPDGHTLASSTGDGVVLRDLTDSWPAWFQSFGNLRRNGVPASRDKVVIGAGRRVRASGNRRLLFAFGGGGGTTIYRVRGDSRISREASSSASPDEAALSPDGRTLAVADKRTELWDTSARGRLRRRLTIDTPASRLLFSADSKLLVAGNGTTVALWDVADQVNPVRVATISTLAGFDGGLLLTSEGWSLTEVSKTGVVVTWDLTNLAEARRDPLARICQHGGAAGRLTRADWTRYLPGVTYQPPC